MKYLLDTCVISDFVRGNAGVLRRIKATLPSLVAVSTVTVMEIEYGLRLNPARARTLESVLSAFLKSVKVLPFERQDATAAAAIRAALRLAGKPIGAYDVLLAGCALCRGLTFVTSNTSEFRRVQGLSVEDWRT